MARPKTKKGEKTTKDFEKKMDRMFDYRREKRSRIGGPSDTEILGRFIVQHDPYATDPEGMLPPEPDWRCKCGEEGKYTEENKTAIERKEKIKCPKCGKDVRILSLVER